MWYGSVMSGERAAMHERTVLAVAVLSLLACGPADTTATSFGVGPGTTPAGSTSSTSSTSSTGSTGTGDGSTSSTGSTSTGPAIDSSTGAELPPDFGPPGPKGCQGKIDFLFVISNSTTMKGHQAQVVAALPDFITKIQAEFAEFDTHIMVTDTDEFWAMDDCSVCGPGCDPGGTPKLCGAKLDACDTTIGAGMIFPSGIDSSARRCELAAGRFITSEDPDPIKAFLCVAKVGSEGSIAPRVADAMVAALSWPLLGTNGYPPGCNQGFLREDALLVVTLITDQYEVDSSGPAEAWRDALMDAKNQDGEAFQVLAITTDVDVGGLCGPYQGSTNRLRTFVDIVPHGKIGSICAPSYGDFFDAAVADVIERCDSFVAPQ